MSYRLAIVASHVIQYQDPFFRLLAAADEIDLTVLYCSRAGAATYLDRDMKTSLRWDLEMLQGYRYEFLRNFGTGDGYSRLINPGVISSIARGRFDAVLFFLGWGTITSLIGLATCRALSTPIMLFGDSFSPPADPRLKSRLRTAFLRTIFSWTSAFMVSGVQNAAYYRHYGASDERFFLLPWAVDNERFGRGSTFNEGERQAMRARCGIRPDQIAFVFSAKLIPRKDPMTLLRALARMERRDRAVAVFLGHGELRSELESFADRNGLNVTFAGFVNQTEIPKHYGMCDVFVLPTLDDPRGTVTNEAMACGLPVIMSDRCGAIGDIVLDGENAITFPAGDDVALAAAMERMLDDRLRAQMARRSREIIAPWDYAAGVRGTIQALRTIVPRDAESAPR